MYILVLCTGNSARSILLESILSQRGASRIRAFSAGSQPTGRVNPLALALLRSKGADTAEFRSKSWDEFATPEAPHMDLVITVCGSAAAEVCPIWPGTPLRGHWGVEDPAAVADAKAPAAFAEAYDILDRRAAAFLAHPIETMDRANLQAHIAACGDLT